MMNLKLEISKLIKGDVVDDVYIVMMLVYLN